MEGIGEILLFIAVLTIGIVSAIMKQQKAGNQTVTKPRSVFADLLGELGETVEIEETFDEEPLEGYSLETAALDAKEHNAEQAPRRKFEAAETSDPVAQYADNEAVAFDFDLRRAVIESEVLTPKYF